MKKLLKILGYLLVVLLFTIVILIIAISLSQNKILKITQKQITKTINAPVLIDDMSFTFIKKFPYATVEFEGVKILPNDLPSGNE